MNEVLERIYRTRTVEDKAGHAFSPLPISIQPDGGRALYELIRRIRPRATLEIGMAYGLSALFICQALRDNAAGGHHTVVDPLQSSAWRSLGRLNLERAALSDLATVHEDPAHVALPHLLSRGERFDLIFMDGMHAFEYVMVDLFYGDKLLRPGGYMVVDDVWMHSVRRAVSAQLRTKRYRVVPEWSKLPNASLRFLSRHRRFWAALRRIPGVPWPSGGAYWATIQKVSEDLGAWLCAEAQPAAHETRMPDGSPRPSGALAVSSVVVAARHPTAATMLGGTTVFDRGREICYSIEGVGERVWALLQQPRSVGQIRDLLLEEYDVEPARCEKDILGLLEELLRAGLIEQTGRLG